jgi:hypothetical protein
MPHKRASRKIKKLERLYSQKPSEEENFNFSSFDKEVLATGNLLPRLSNEEVKAINYVICERYHSAKDKTDEISAKMDLWEKQYKGEWVTDDAKNNKDHDIFLRKTKEQVRVVYSHVISIVNDLFPIVTLNPIVSCVNASDDEYRRSKLAEALVNYILNDLLRFKEDIFPQWLKSTLKNTMGILKLTYRGESTRSDFILENIDRSSIYIDPNAKHDIKNAHWVIEKFGMTKREVLKRVNDKYWRLPNGMTENDIIRLPSYSGSNDNISSSQRVFEQALNQRTTIEEDELVEVWEYWSSASTSLSDVYAVMVGGEGGMLLRYGPNPYPYKKHPYFAKSYDAHELEVDGEGLVEEMEGIQKVTNTMLNLRLKDVRENIIQRVATVGKYIDKNTIEDFQENRKFVRLSDEALLASKTQENFRLADQFFPLPVNTSTGELWQDLSFYLGQAKETTGVNDALAGSAMPRQMTKGQFDQTLNRAVGVMMPFLLSIGSMFEEIGEAILTYLKDPSFFGNERIIRVMGNSKYTDIIENWHSMPDGSFIRDVQPDDMLVEGTMTATDGFEDQIKRQMTLSQIVGMLQAISVNPDMYADAREEINFANLAKMMIRNSGVKDIESITFSDEEKKQRRISKAKQQAIEERKQLEMMQLEGKQKAALKSAEINEKAEADMAKHQGNKIADANAEITVDTQRVLNETESDIAVNNAKVDKETESDLIKMSQEYLFEKQNLQHDKAVNINK